MTTPKAVEKLKEYRKQVSSGFLGLFKSPTLTKAVDQAVSRIERELTTGQNGR
jgi:hypothetical protein